MIQQRLNTSHWSNDFMSWRRFSKSLKGLDLRALLLLSSLMLLTLLTCRGQHPAAVHSSCTYDVMGDQKRWVKNGTRILRACNSENIHNMKKELCMSSVNMLKLLWIKSRLILRGSGGNFLRFCWFVCLIMQRALCASWSRAGGLGRFLCCSGQRQKSQTVTEQSVSAQSSGGIHNLPFESLQDKLNCSSIKCMPSF